MKKYPALFLCLFLTTLAQADSPPTTPPTVPQFGTPYAHVPDPKDVILYQINIRAFSPTDNFAGVQARLDAIKSLGVNVIYLLPIYPVGNLKAINSPYCIKDYTSVNSEFGSLDDLRTLVAEAHKRNMAVLFDWVADHTSWDNNWITHKSWYKQDADGNIISPPNTGWNDVAALNFDNPEMRQAMIDAMKYWIYQTNIDGYRCDAADFVPFDFWQQAIKSLRDISTHKLLLFAEGTRPDHFTAGFQLEYGMKFYYNMVNNIFGKRGSAQSIDPINTSEYNTATADDQIVRYISNHDLDATDGTPLDLLGGQRGSLAAFVVAAYFKGVPMIYNGQEVACPLKLDIFDTKTTIDWTANPNITAEYKKILAFRNTSHAIKESNPHSYSSTDICAFTKTKDNEQVLVIVNLRNTPITYQTPQELINTNWKDAFTQSPTTLPPQIDLQPYQYKVLQK